MSRSEFFIGVSGVNATIAECADREWLAILWVVASVLFAIQATVSHIGSDS